MDLSIGLKSIRFEIFDLNTRINLRGIKLAKISENKIHDTCTLIPLILTSTTKEIKNSV